MSIILAVGAGIYMSFWGGPVHGELDTKTGQMLITRTGFDHPILILYVLLPIFGLIGIQKRNIWILSGAAVGMVFLVVLFFSFIGAVFLPSTLLLILAAIFFRKETESMR